MEASSLKDEDTQRIAKLVQHTLDDHDVLSMHHLRVAAAGQSDKPAALTIQLDSAAEDQEIVQTLQQYEPILKIRHPANHNSASASNHALVAEVVASALMGLFAEEQATLAHLLSTSGISSPKHRVSSEFATAVERRGNRAFKYAPTYHLTFSLFSGSSTPVSWDIQASLNEYLLPLLSSFSAISNFTVDTQVQLFASLSPSLRGPDYDEQSKRWTLQRSDLSGFINAAEWPLSPSIGAGPTINFVLYVPSDHQSPMVIEGSRGTSWLIPQWGGVEIFNPSTRQRKEAHLTRQDLEPIMLTFAEQLVSLLGVPASPSSLALRLASLTRERAASRMLSASSTLGALARLTIKLTSIAIPDNVAVSVDKSIQHLELACTDLREARYSQALDNARIAEAEAEQAFFEPSMVGQVYFPDEHKVAVYVPLLGPMAVPLITAVLKEFKKWKRSRP